MSSRSYRLPGVALISLRWRLRFFWELVSAEETRDVVRVHVGVAPRTNFLVRCESRCDRRGSDRRQDCRAGRRSRWRFRRHLRFLAGSEEREEEEQAEEDRN